MKKIEKDLIIGVINSATHKAAKQFEKGLLVSDSEFQKLLQQSNKYKHLFFFVNTITIKYNQNQVGKPCISIICSAEGYTFKSSFILAKPHGKFNSETPIAQQFYIEQIS
ncbi:hypothetical protein [Tenacibaculum insulae]|uniref:hypothetical protein n=1 Tax=Tenacibaculum insulae TaxID=2029677 RepID=UPI003AB2C071